MIVLMAQEHSETDLRGVLAHIQTAGLRASVSRAGGQTIVGVIGIDARRIDASLFDALPGVARCASVAKPYKLASREFHPHATVVHLPGPRSSVAVGSSAVVVMAGPCAVESWDQLAESADAVLRGGAHVLRGGAFKPRTSPYAFQGLGLEGLRLLARARKEAGMPVVTEVMTPAAVPVVADYADCLQVGARNMQNFALLQECGKARKPVLLKRGPSGTIDELLMAAEYVLAHGNPDVILCERGIRTFERATRNTLDLSAVPLLKELTHLPVAVDPSHGTGVRSLVVPMALAAVAAGADAVIVEVHPDPERAMSDGAQSLTPGMFSEMMARLDPVARSVGRFVEGAGNVAAA